MWSRGHRSKRAEEVGVARRELKKASERLLLPHDVTDEATYIYTRSLKTGLAKGRPLIQIAASSLYAACREKNIPTTLDDVASASGVGRQALARWYRYLVAELDLKIPVADPAECLAEVASRAKADPKVEADALEILSKAAKAGITAGLGPLPGVAAQRPVADPERRGGGGRRQRSHSPESEQAPQEDRRGPVDKNNAKEED